MPERDRLKFQYLEEQYETLTLLGEKADGQVFLAKDKRSGRIVVKKYVSSETALLCGRLCGVKNRYLAEIYETAADGDRGVILEEYVNGFTLRKCLDERGNFAEEEVVSVVIGLCEALAVLHGMGMVHRDINPDNVMLSGDGIVKLIDLGIAREVKCEKRQDTAILGTVGYAAPEQFGFRQTDERTDIYALGVLMNVMLTGKLSTDLRYPQETVLGAAIRRCLEIDPEKRFQNVFQLQASLDGARESVISTDEVSQQDKIKNKGYQIAGLPGFRTGVLWKNVIAILGYGMMILFSYIFVEECAVSTEAFLLELLAVFLYIWAATLLAFNVADWDKRLFPFHKFPRQVCIAIRVVLWILIFYYGVELENYVKYEIIGLPIQK